MKLMKRAFYFMPLAVLLLASCYSEEDSDIDEQKPTISLNSGFPQSCEELKRGETYTFRATAADNLELASYSLNIHHNFDHHTHDDQGASCELNAVKASENPMIFMENYSLEEGLTSYEINLVIEIPNDVDTGDYHCAYSVTDVTGWQARTSVDIKIVE